MYATMYSFIYSVNILDSQTVDHTDPLEWKTGAFQARKSQLTLPREGGMIMLVYKMTAKNGITNT